MHRLRPRLERSAANYTKSDNSWSAGKRRAVRTGRGALRPAPTPLTSLKALCHSLPRTSTRRSGLDRPQMLEDCAPLVNSLLRHGRLDLLDDLLFDYRRSFGDNNAKEDDRSSNNDVDSSSDGESERLWWSESDEESSSSWSESLDGLITMNADLTGRATDASETSALSISPGREREPHHSESFSLRADALFIDADTTGGKHANPKKRDAFAMVFENIKNSVFRRRADHAQQTQTGNRSTTPIRTVHAHTLLSVPLSTSSSISSGAREQWNASCLRFTNLKHFVWLGGAPQFTFAVSSSTGDVVVRDVLSEKAYLSAIQVGDVLEAVADVWLRGMSLGEIASLMAMVATPAVLRFRADAATGTEKRWEHEQFHVILRDKRLGATFTSDGPRHIPVVSRVAHSDAPAAAFGIRPGDVLVAVNDQDAISMGLGRVIELVRAAPRPISFTFQRARVASGFTRRSAGPECAASRSLEIGTTAPTWHRASLIETKSTSDVLIVWKEGPLGVTFVPDILSGLPVVNRLTGKGTSRGLELVHHGFLLHSVNGQKLVDFRMDEWQSMLSELCKPALLVFKPPKSPRSVADGSSDGEWGSGSDSFAFTSPSTSPRAPLAMVETAATDQILASLATSSSTDDSSEAEAAASRSALDTDDCYLVLWNEPRLGLGLSLEYKEPRFQAAGDRDRQQASLLRLVPIVRVVQNSCRLQFPGNPAGDWLIAINGREAIGLDEDELRDLAASASKPAVLRFHRPLTRQALDPSRSNASPTTWWDELHDSDDEETASCLPSELATAAPPTLTHYCYQLLWPPATTMGLTFASSLNSDRSGRAVVFVKRVDPNGYAAATSLVAKGDELVAVNSSALSPSRSFDEAMHWLARQKRPLLLGFARPLVERESVRGGAAAAT